MTRDTLIAGNPETDPTANSKEEKPYITISDDRDRPASEKVAVIISWILVVITFPISIFICFITVAEFQRAVVLRLGRIRRGSRGPGLVWTLPCIDTYVVVDLRTRVRVIPSQDVLTKDSVTVCVDAVVFYCIDSAMHATLQISNVHQSTVFIASTTLRNVVGSKTLHELLTSRESLSIDIKIASSRAAAKWGVKVERVDIKEISLPDVLQRSLASEAEALRNARAKIISAEGEYNAATALKEASDIMQQTPIALQLRHLETLILISRERRLTILYPFPMELMDGRVNAAGDRPMPVNNPRVIIGEDTESVTDSVHNFFTSLLSPFVNGTEETFKSNKTNENENENVKDKNADEETSEPYATISRVLIPGHTKETQTDFPAAD